MKRQAIDRKKIYFIKGYIYITQRTLMSQFQEMNNLKMCTFSDIYVPGEDL